MEKIDELGEKMSKKVFVTYSWDSEEHGTWVMQLVNTLRKDDGIEATLDKYILQDGTNNLNRMMVDNIHNYDYVVVVLTENYKERANNEMGGVGFESTMLMDIIKNPQERNKIIPLNRHNGNFDATIPNFLRGYNLIDVSDTKLEDGYNELVRKIKEVQKYKIPELGKGKEIKPEDVGTFNFGKVKVPNLAPITPQNKEEFIKENFDKMIENFKEYFEEVRAKNSNFSYEITENEDFTFVKTFINNELIKGLKFWLGNFGSFGGRNSKEQINYSLDINSLNKNTYNGMITAKLDNNKQFVIENSLSTFGRGNTNNINDISRDIIEKEFLNALESFHSRNMIKNELRY